MPRETRVVVRWTPEEDDQLRRLYPVTTIRECARLIGRSKGAVTGRAAALGLKKPVREKPPRKRREGPREWAVGETMRLFECWGGTVEAAALAVGRPAAEVAARARALKVPLAGATGKECA